MIVNEIEGKLARYEITLGGLIYKSEDAVEVYHGMYRQSKAAIKIIQLPPNTDYTILERECQTLTSLFHPNILRLFTCFWTYDSRQMAYLVLATQLCLKDIGKEITQRSRTNAYWEESELWTILSRVLDALLFMKEKEIAHRDIKPENLFIDESGRVILGDFGSAKVVSSMCQQTLTGTPLYLSPLLRAGYAHRQIAIEHDVYKSDVYSLGVTFIYMATLKVPMFMFGPAAPGAAEALSSATYSAEFKQVLLWMVAEKESDRYDLSQLKEHVEKLLLLRNVTTEVREGPGRQSLAEFQARLARLACVSCKKELNRKKLSEDAARLGVVQLLCNPSDHVFCSLECFTKYCQERKNGLVCPECNTPIADELVPKIDESKSSWCSLW